MGGIFNLKTNFLIYKHIDIILIYIIISITLLIYFLRKANMDQTLEIQSRIWELHTVRVERLGKEVKKINIDIKHFKKMSKQAALEESRLAEQFHKDSTNISYDQWKQASKNCLDIDRTLNELHIALYSLEENMVKDRQIISKIVNEYDIFSYIAKRRMLIVKEQIMAQVYKPENVSRWLEMPNGEQIFDMMFGT